MSETPNQQDPRYIYNPYSTPGQDETRGNLQPRFGGEAGQDTTQFPFSGETGQDTTQPQFGSGQEEGRGSFTLQGNYQYGGAGSTSNGGFTQGNPGQAGPQPTQYLQHPQQIHQAGYPHSTQYAQQTAYSPQTPYGQQTGYNSYPKYTGYNQTPAGPVEKPVRPNTVKFAVYALIIVVLLGIISTVWEFISPTSLMEDSFLGTGAGSSSDPFTQNSEVPAGFMVAVYVLTAVFTVIEYAIYTLFAVFTWKGTNWARIALTVVFGLQMLGALAMPFALMMTGFHAIYLLGIASFVLSVGGVIWLWIKPSNLFFQKMKQYKQWKSFNS